MPRKTPRPKLPADENMTTAAICEYFAGVPDPRIERSQLHPLTTILVLSLCAVICGADSFVAIEQFGLARRAWLDPFIDFPNGIPSHDTLGRVFSALSPTALAEAFRGWVAAVARITTGQVVAIDGKTLRRSYREAGSGAFVHMVSAWATQNRIVLGQVKTEEKSNEITAIPKLLELLRIKGCLVTIDAMGCQKHIAEEIVHGGADYLLAVKDNQPTLNAEVIAVFQAARRDPSLLENMDYCETRDVGHGRIEVRRCWTTDDVQRVPSAGQWRGLHNLALVEVERTVKGKTSIEQRHYICSRARLPATSALDAARSHWGIENQLHWVLDVAFREDDCRIRAGNAAENFAVMRHLALNMLKSVQGTKVGIQIRRLRAGWENDFFLRVLGARPEEV